MDYSTDRYVDKVRQALNVCTPSITESGTQSHPDSRISRILLCRNVHSKPFLRFVGFVSASKRNIVRQVTFMLGKRQIHQRGCPETAYAWPRYSHVHAVEGDDLTSFPFRAQTYVWNLAVGFER